MDTHNTTQPPAFAEEKIKTNFRPLKPNTWLWQAIVVTLCCNTPFGIVALVYSARVNSAYSTGDYAGAERFSRRAKIWALTGLAVGLAYAIYAAIILTKDGLVDLGSILDGGAPSPYNL